MCVALGGRLAEELINGLGNVTTGASNDFQQTTQVAKAMVTQLGMSETWPLFKTFMIIESHVKGIIGSGNYIFFGSGLVTTPCRRNVS